MASTTTRKKRGPGRKPGPRTKASLAAEKRRQETAAREARRTAVMQLHIAGRSTREIAETLADPRSGFEPVSHVTILNDIRVRLAEHAKEDKRKVEEWRELQIARCQALIARWWKPAQDNQLAFKRVLEAMARLDKYTGASLVEKVAIIGDRDAPPVQVETVNKSEDFDLDKLSLEDLLQLRVIRDKARVEEPGPDATIH